jgi:predicted XRE-type DNA-binding protein
MPVRRNPEKRPAKTRRSSGRGTKQSSSTAGRGRLKSDGPECYEGTDVFADLGFDAAEAQSLRIRAELMAAIARFIEKDGLTQGEAAERMGVSQPRVSDVVRGRIDRFSIDALVEMLARAGWQVHVRVRLSV